MPRWWYARFSVSWFLVIQAICEADNARIALITKSLVKDIAKNLQSHSVSQRFRQRIQINRKFSHRHLLSPHCATAIPKSMHVDREARNMVDKTQVRSGEFVPVRSGTPVQLEFRERGVPRLLPGVYLDFDLGGHQQVGISRTGRWIVGCNTVHVIATAVVLCAVSAVSQRQISALPTPSPPPSFCSNTKGFGRCSPLWHRLVASNVSPLARIASLSGLGMASAWWSTSRAGHLESRRNGRRKTKSFDVGKHEGYHGKKYESV